MTIVPQLVHPGHAILHGDSGDERTARLAPLAGFAHNREEGNVVMTLTGHQIGVLRSYMQDLVDQAAQEDEAARSFGFRADPYRPDQAISDLLAILDDRIESEGLQVGLEEEFLHQMWTLCNEAQPFIKEQVWLQSNLGQAGSVGATSDPDCSRARVRELTYRALLAFLQR